MSEYYSGLPLGEDSIRGQREFLFDMKERVFNDNNCVLAEKVDELLAEDEVLQRFLGDHDTNYVRPDIAVTKKESLTGEPPVETMHLRFKKTIPAENGAKNIYHYIPVAETFSGGPLYVYDRFSDEEALLVANQVDLLRTAQDEGLLPNLNPSLTEIQDQSTAIMKIED